MNCRNTTKALDQQTRWWGKAASLGAALLFAYQTNAQISAYSFTASTGSYTEIATGTDVNTIETDDAHSASLPLGFTFNFNGVNYTDVKANSNGWISFEVADAPSAAQQRNNNLATGPAAARPGVYPLWDDLDGGHGTGVAKYETTGSVGSRVFTMEWRNWQWNWQATGNTISFQVKLFEGTNVIEFIYRQEAGTVSNTTSGASIGIAGTATGAGNYLSLNNTSASPTASSTTETSSLSAKPATNQVYTFTPPIACTSLPSLVGGTAAATVTSGCGSVATSTLSVTGATGGATGFTYQWRSGPPGGPYSTNLGTAATQVVTSVTSTTAYVRDIICTGGPATATSSEVVITVNPTITAGASASPAGPFCGAASTALTATGGLTYSWSPATGLDGTTGATVNCTATNTTTYTVTATGVGGCTGTANVTVTVNPLSVVQSTTATPNPVCFNGNSNLNVVAGPVSTNFPGGAVTINDGNGSPYPSTVAVSGVSGTLSNIRVTITNLAHTFPADIDMVLFGPTGAHSIIFTDAIGTGVVTGLNYTFEIGATALPTSGSPASGTYGVVNGGSWNGSGTPGTVSSANLSNFLGTNPNGTWSLYVFDDAGGDAGSLASWNLEIITGGAPVASYSWSPNTYLNDPTLANPTATGVVTTENYTVTVTATNGCTSTGSVTLVPSAPITAASITGGLAYCAGSSTTLTAVPADGGAPFTYLWSPGGETTASIVVTTPGNYSCQVTDNCGGSVNTGTVTVVENAVPTASASSNSPLCTGNPLNLNGTTDVGTIFTWSGPGGYASTSEDPTIPSAALSNDGVYTFTASTAFCSSTPVTTTVVVNATPTGVTANVSDNVVCDGDLVDLTSTVDSPSPTILTENFNGVAAGWTTVNNSTGGTPANAAWTLRPSPFAPGGSWTGNISSNDATQYYFTNGDAPGSGSTSATQLISPVMDLTNYTAASLNFWHFYQDIAGDDTARVEVSTNGGANWAIVQTYNTTQGTQTGFVNATVSLDSYVGLSTVQFRFRYRGTWDWGWAVDNVTVTGTPVPYTFAWTSSPSGFTSAVQNPTGVSATPLPTTYTVTVSTAFCSAQANVTVNPDLTDTDGDSVTDCVDTCPTFPGQEGDFCDSNPGAGYTLGQITGCTCVPVVCTTNLNIIFNPDGVTDIQWEIRQQGSNVLVQAGGGVYPATPEYSEATCLPNGDFYLVVTSNTGGIVQNGYQGGYRLRTSGGLMVVDNRNNFLSGSTSQIAGGEGFSIPLSADRTIFTSSDKLDWQNNEYIYATDNPAVTAQYGVNNANNGYQMWWYNPNGGYSFRRFQNHNTSNGLPASSTRACGFKINSWSGNQLQNGTLYNVKVRSMVNGVYGNWGAATRFRIDAARAQCPLTNLMDLPGNQFVSCGGTRALGTSQPHLVHARPVKKLVSGAWVNANRYQFRFISENTIIKTSNTNQYWVYTGSAPSLQAGVTYEVEVRASFDNGATWCDTYPATNPFAPKWGKVCLLTISGAAQGGNQNLATTTNNAEVGLYPNPNNGQQLTLSLSQVAAGTKTVTVDILDTFGKRVSARTIAVNDTFVNTVLELNGELAAGMYLVNITAGDATYTERLVIQP